MSEAFVIVFAALMTGAFASMVIDLFIRDFGVSMWIGVAAAAAMVLIYILSGKTRTKS